MSDDGQAWLQSLLGGALGAGLGAGVAVYVLSRSLKSQREENVRSRMRDSTAALLSNCYDLADSIQRKPRHAPDYLRAFSEFTINLERLHLDLREDEAGIYHAVHALIGETHEHVSNASRDGRVLLTDSDRDALVGIFGILASFIAEWVRATKPSERKEVTGFLTDLFEMIRDHGLDAWRRIDEYARRQAERR